jgi:hypothetical protein
LKYLKDILKKRPPHAYPPLDRPKQQSHSMKISSLFPASSTLGLFTAALLLAPPAEAAKQAGSDAAGVTVTTPTEKPKKGPVGSGIVDLKFEDFFSSPVGPRGLELTEKVRSLDGKRVRIVGFMVRQEKSYPGVFIMAPLPVQTDEDHYGAGDDLPPATLYVLVPGHSNEVVRYQKGLLRLTGVLSLGAHEEADGRMSTARLALDASNWGHGGSRPISSSAKGAQQLMR